MSELIEIKIDLLKENETFSNLVPKMDESEWQDFLKSVKKHGIRQPIHILKNNTILDGRHRVNACKYLGIGTIQALVHEMSESEAIQFVTDTAIERRNLTKEQKLDILLNCEELINKIQSEAKERLSPGTNQYTESGLGPREPRPKPLRTNEVLGEMSGTSKSTVARMKKIKNEAPETYKEVVKGSVTVGTAYNELPSVQANKGSGKGSNKEKIDKEPKLSDLSLEPEYILTEDDIKKETYSSIVDMLDGIIQLTEFEPNSKYVDECLIQISKNEKELVLKIKLIIEKLGGTHGN